MKRIAIIIDDDIYNRKGLMNAELNRISHLMPIVSYEIDVYTFQIYEGWLVRKLRHTSKVDRPDKININGIDIRVKWRSFSLLDYILTVLLHKSPIVNKNWTLKYAYLFKDYDLISVHSDALGTLALHINKVYNIPYVVTWHGSDIHTAPFTSKYAFNNAKKILESASMNFMVSYKLEELSKKISTTAKTMVLYNGVNKSFRRFSDNERLLLRKKYGVDGKKVVAFAGHLIEVKNPHLFPEIFKDVRDKCNCNIEFWIMGSGKMGKLVQDKCEEYGLPLRMWGNIPAEEMPSMLNCVDVQILPSRNEGLPLIAAEAMACGANAVGASVGGIPEVMGVENTFPHGDSFIEEIADRIVYMLENQVSQNLKACFDWNETAIKENQFYNMLLK